MTYDTIRVWSDGPIGHLELARPEVRNAQSAHLLDELDQALTTMVDDPAVRVIVISGAGDHFSAGHDVKEGKARIAEINVEDRWDYEQKRYFDYCMRIWDAPKPTIAQVQGACIAGGFMIANVCDLIVASDDAFFSDPVVHKLSAAATEVLIHPWVMGFRQAKELLYTGKAISAERAFQMGMINRVVPMARLEEETLTLAEQVAAAPPFALRLVKRSINRTLDTQGLRAALSAHFDTHQLSHRTDEYMKVRAAGVDTILTRERAE